MEKLCVIRIASIIKKRRGASIMASSLRLSKLYSCTILDKTEPNLNMLRRAEEMFAYGEINTDSLKALLQKRATAAAGGKYVWQNDSLESFVGAFSDGKQTLEDAKIKNVFALHPPIKGFERKGKKTPFSLGGAFGYRGAAINDLLKRMI